MDYLLSSIYKTFNNNEISFIKFNDLHNEYITNPNNVYKLCANEWLIILRKISITLTNENMHNIIDPLYANDFT